MSVRHEPILVLNTGSSSLKFGLFTLGKGGEQALFSGTAGGIGAAGGTLQIRNGTGQAIHDSSHSCRSHGEALQAVAEKLADLAGPPPIAVGHRIVHGGPHLLEPQFITAEVEAELHRREHFAPVHIPLALDLLQRARQLYPDVAQYACFDTWFHRTLPPGSARFALPQWLHEQGIRRYGFHGLSYESIVHQLGAELPARTVVAHLGNGASLAALDHGVSVDTSMGLTPTGGIPMSTRSGDLDPGVLLFLLRAKGMDADSMERLLNRESGLLALSGGERDMRALQHAAQRGDADAANAIEVFCTAVAKVVVSYAVVLQGLDMLVFTGGIGEHGAAVRERVCRLLSPVGAEIDEAANERAACDITGPRSRFSIRVVPSGEEAQIARHGRALLHS